MTDYIVRISHGDSWAFTQAGVDNPEKAREEWEGVLDTAMRRNDEVKERRDAYKEKSDKLEKFLKQEKIDISARRMSGLMEEVRKSTIGMGSYNTTSIPYITAKMVDEQDRMVSAPIYSSALLDFNSALLAIQSYIKQGKEQKKSMLEKQKASIEYCVKHDIENWTPDTACDLATAHYYLAYVKEAVENETVFSLDECENCSTWTAGNRRCRCGNRRVDLSYDGIYPEIYIYPEAW